MSWLVNNQKIVGMLGLATKAGKVVVGTEATLEAIGKHKVKMVLVATDASEKTKHNIAIEAHKQEIQVYSIATIEEMSKAIGKHNKAIIGITDIHFAQAIEKNINGGDVIG